MLRDGGFQSDGPATDPPTTIAISRLRKEPGTEFAVYKIESMNYFTHALPHLRDPVYIAGTALPDWLSVVNRKVRVRTKTLTPFFESDDPFIAALATGAQRHLDDDGWFHATRGFAEVTAELGLLFRDRLGGTDGFRCGFLAHLALELLLDAVLWEQFPREMDVYYDLLAEVDAARVEAVVTQITGQNPEGLAWLIEHYRREEILRDYADDARLARRLNQVLRRVKLTPLPDEAPRWLAEARQIVRARVMDVLPPTDYPWPQPVSVSAAPFLSERLPP